jgi:cysteinyl-tRNA synthetase
MPIHIYNTLTRQKEELVPVEPGKIKFYLCGPTVYDYFHIGNARPFVVFDVYRRYLRYRGYQVRFVMNLTDVDDRIIDRANERGLSAQEVAARYTVAFFEDLQRLGVQPADVYPRATEHISEIITLVQTLLDKGFAYELDGDVYFNVGKFKSYAKLSGKKLDELESGARVAVDDRKRNPLDFALWKAMKPGEPSWESPWGEGRPGWHAECSAMSMKYLGETFDIHAGGLDLIFPHHENEIAQSEGATGKPFVKYWMHNGFLDIDGEKMSKSLGNFKTARDVLEKYPAAAVRLFFLMKHYRSPIDFSQEALDSALKARERLSMAYQLLKQKIEPPGIAAPAVHEAVAKFKEEIIAAMDDDFNSAKALGIVFDLVRETNRRAEQSKLSTDDGAFLSAARSLLDEVNGFFGVFDQSAAGVDQTRVDAIMNVVIDLRKSLRSQKNFAMADEIRDKLKAAGVVLEDGPRGTRWRWGSAE